MPPVGDATCTSIREPLGAATPEDRRRSGASSTAAPRSTTTATDLTIGALNANGVSQFFNGLIDEMTIYNQALSAAQIQNIYDAGSAGKCKPAAPDTVPPVTTDVSASPNPAPVNSPVILSATLSETG